MLSLLTASYIFIHTLETMEAIRIVLAATLFLLLAACSPRVVTSVTTPYPPLPSPHSVNTFEYGDSVPATAVVIGNISVESRIITIHCGYNRVSYLAKEATANAGGNGLYIINHKKPDLFGGNCHQISGVMLYLGDRGIIDSIPPTLSSDFVEINRKIIQKIRRRRRPPETNITVNVGYSWFIDKLYDIDTRSDISGLGGMEWQMRCDHVWRSGWSLGGQASLLWVDMKGMNFKQYQFAPQVGYWDRRGAWMFKMGIGGGYLYSDNPSHQKNGFTANLNLGAEYMLTRFLGVGVSADAQGTYFPEKFNKKYPKDDSEMKRRLALLAGFRLYF